MIGTGTLTAGLGAGGYGSSSNQALVKGYDGTDWTTLTSMNTARRHLGGSGTHTSSIVFGGYITAASALTDDWNGTTWTEVSDLGTA